MEQCISARESQLFEPHFLTSDNQALCKFESDQVRQVPGALVDIHSYALKDALIQEFFFHILLSWKVQYLFLAVHDIWSLSLTAIVE